MATPLRKRALSRRTFLRGAGVSVAVPWLDAMVPSLSPQPESPLRCVFVFSPNGKKMDDWRPERKERGFALPYLLEPLAPFRDQLLVFSGLTLDGGRAHGDGPGDHARSAGSFLTCAHPFKTGGADIKVGVSADQVIATGVGGATKYASLELGMERGRSAGVCDSGYSCAYSNNVSWRTPNTPVAKETDPREVFARLFGDPDDALGQLERDKLVRRRRSVLDAVLDDAKSLSGKLGSNDRSKLEDYLTAVRELEQRLGREDGPTVDVPEGIAKPKTDFPGRLDLMYEMVALALRADLTRVVTFMLGNAGSNRSYRFLGVPDGHHSLSHHGRQEHKLAAIRKINRFHMERFSGFIGRLQAVEEGNGDLLRHTMVMYGSGLADGHAHRHDDLPVLLAGGGLLGDRHLRTPRNTPMANLYLSMMARMGVRREAFADSTGRLDL